MFYTDHTEDTKACRKEIAKIKARLIKKVQSKGLYENFGQNEVRILNHKYFGYGYASADIRDMLSAFNDWAMNYTGR